MTFPIGIYEPVETILKKIADYVETSKTESWPRKFQMNSNYQSINRKVWNQGVSTHLASDLHNLESWKAGKTSLNRIELGLLGDVTDKSFRH